MPTKYMGLLGPQFGLNALLRFPQAPTLGAGLRFGIQRYGFTASNEPGLWMFGLSGAGVYRLPLSPLFDVGFQADAGFRIGTAVTPSISITDTFVFGPMGGLQA